MSNTVEMSMFPKEMTEEDVMAMSDKEIMKYIIADKRRQMQTMVSENLRRQNIRRRRQSK